MATARRDVFINCPFDSGYRAIFDALVFTVIRAGFRARSSLEGDDAAENRLAKIQRIIAECRYGIHDISRTESDGEPPLPRFNMPFELGLFLGAKRYGNDSSRRKQCLIFDRAPHRYQRFISDIAGQDIHSHEGEPAIAVRELSGWLRRHSNAATVPGGQVVFRDYQRFRADLPEICRGLSITEQELTFSDFTNIVASYVAER